MAAKRLGYLFCAQHKHTLEYVQAGDHPEGEVEEHDARGGRPTAGAEASDDDAGADPARKTLRSGTGCREDEEAVCVPQPLGRDEDDRLPDVPWSSGPVPVVHLLGRGEVPVNCWVKRRRQKLPVFELDRSKGEGETKIKKDVLQSDRSMRAAFSHSMSSGECQKLSIPRRLTILFTEAPTMEPR